MDETTIKSSLYENEIPYRMVKNIAEIYYSHQYMSELQRYGLLLIKPETILLGKTQSIFSILRASEYELVYFLYKKICPTCISEMWCKLRSNGTSVPPKRNGYSILNGTKYRFC